MGTPWVAVLPGRMMRFQAHMHQAPVLCQMLCSLLPGHGLIHAASWGVDLANPILQVRSQGFQEDKYLARGPIVSKGQKLDLIFSLLHWC